MTKRDLANMHGGAVAMHTIDPDDQITQDYTNAFWEALERANPSYDWDTFYWDNFKATQTELLNLAAPIVSAMA